MAHDPVRTVEACYAPAATEPEWLEGLLETLAALRGADALWAATFDTSDPARFRVGTVVARGEAFASLVDGFRRTWESVPSEFANAFWRSVPPVGTMTQRLRSHPSPPAAVGAYLGAVPGEAVSVVGANPDGRGVQLGYLAQAGHVPAPRTVHQLRLVAAHVAAGFRLRRASAAPAGEPDAVLAPSGRIEAARGEALGAGARRRLVEAVRDAERARGKLRRASPEEALALWRGLMAGEWSLVDHEERDGRRFVLARQNRPSVPDVKGMRRREREVLAYAVRGHSNKYIAYELGVSPATVAAHLAAAQEKLGVASRREAIALLGGGHLARARDGGGDGE